VDIAERQHGRLTRGDLRRAGLTDSEIRHWIRTRRLLREHRGVYALGHAAPTAYGRFMAAVLACGEAAALSSLSAAVLWGLLPDREHEIHVTTTGPHRRGPKGIRLHRAATVHTTRHHGIPVTTPTQTILDLAAQATDRDLATATNEAQVRRLIRPDTILTSAVGRRGASRLTALLEDGPGHTRSEAERRLLALVARAHLPRPLTNVKVAGHEVDAFWPRHGLVLEVDGYAAHYTRTAFERDRRRDQDLLASGLRTMRTTWRQIAREPEALAARLAVALIPSRRS